MTESVGICRTVATYLENCCNLSICHTLWKQKRYFSKSSIYFIQKSKLTNNTILMGVLIPRWSFMDREQFNLKGKKL